MSYSRAKAKPPKVVIVASRRAIPLPRPAASPYWRRHRTAGRRRTRPQATPPPYFKIKPVRRSGTESLQTLSGGGRWIRTSSTRARAALGFGNGHAHQLGVFGSPTFVMDGELFCNRTSRDRCILSATRLPDCQQRCNVFCRECGALRQAVVSV